MPCSSWSPGAPPRQGPPRRTTAPSTPGPSSPGPRTWSTVPPRPPSSSGSTATPCSGDTPSPVSLCELDGQGPVPVPLARALSVDAFLAVVFTEAGDIRAVSHRGRTINAKLRTALVYRDRTCVVPGCTMAYGLEIDHGAHGVRRHHHLGQPGPAVHRPPRSRPTTAGSSPATDRPTRTRSGASPPATLRPGARARRSTDQPPTDRSWNDQPPDDQPLGPTEPPTGASHRPTGPRPTTGGEPRTVRIAEVSRGLSGRASHDGRMARTCSRREPASGWTDAGPRTSRLLTAGRTPDPARVRPSTCACAPRLTPSTIRSMSEPVPSDGTVVVIGASLAGLRAAEEVRHEGHTGPVVVVGEEAPRPLRPTAAVQAAAVGQVGRGAHPPPHPRRPRCHRARVPPGTPGHRPRRGGPHRRARRRHRAGLRRAGRRHRGRHPQPAGHRGHAGRVDAADPRRLPGHPGRPVGRRAERPRGGDRRRVHRLRGGRHLPGPRRPGHAARGVPHAPGPGAR